MFVLLCVLHTVSFLGVIRDSGMTLFFGYSYIYFCIKFFYGFENGDGYSLNGYDRYKKRDVWYENNGFNKVICYQHSDGIFRYIYT